MTATVLCRYIMGLRPQIAKSHQVFQLICSWIQFSSEKNKTTKNPPNTQQAGFDRNLPNNEASSLNKDLCSFGSFPSLCNSPPKEDVAPESFKLKNTENFLALELAYS